MPTLYRNPAALRIQRRVNNSSSSSNLVIWEFLSRWIHQFFPILFLLCWLLISYFGSLKIREPAQMRFTAGSLLQFSCSAGWILAVDR